ncbi:hypothetical protein C7W88_08375 [Novosphingobium sp. THN1]|jgi:hypothetical protein|uniref:hypothetical protein n=1 Tax=unclassified Novosphingobium TaxID=2644732 RepID=UPI000E4F7F56|nr:MULTISPECIES: hypothetical protein [unclassified Novosphingobium]AXU19040.1 hypothetical protein C7W88_08375 [Novosphingobium sp. THN1]MBA4088118.1 hypothetical protein [Novosphingobium sp.]NLR38718.1 hypothetical protein [Novosphingobium sp. ERW19]
MPDPELAKNPVTVARLQVEAIIPPEKRGPGWDRHWRELEAYADAAMEGAIGDWTVSPDRTRG